MNALLIQESFTLIVITNTKGHKQDLSCVFRLKLT